MGYHYSLYINGKIRQGRQDAFEEILRKHLEDGEVVIEKPEAEISGFWVDLTDSSAKWRNAEENLIQEIVSSKFLDEGEEIRVEWVGEDDERGRTIVDSDGAHAANMTPLADASDEELLAELAGRGIGTVTLLRLGESEDYALFVGKTMVHGVVGESATDMVNPEEEIRSIADDLARALGRNGYADKTLDLSGLSKLGFSFTWDDVEMVFADDRDTLLREEHIRPDLTVHEVHPYGISVVNRKGLYFAVAKNFEKGKAFAEDGDRSGILAELEAREFDLGDGEDKVLFFNEKRHKIAVFDIGENVLFEIEREENENR